MAAKKSGVAPPTPFKWGLTSVTYECEVGDCLLMVSLIRMGDDQWWEWTVFKGKSGGPNRNVAEGESETKGSAQLAAERAVNGRCDLTKSWRQTKR